MKFRHLLTFVFLMCGVLSVNAQLKDNSIDIASGDSVSSNVASVSQETIGINKIQNKELKPFTENNLRIEHGLKLRLNY